MAAVPGPLYEALYEAINDCSTRIAQGGCCYIFGRWEGEKGIVKVLESEIPPFELSTKKKQKRRMRTRQA